VGVIETRDRGQVGLREFVSVGFTDGLEHPLIALAHHLPGLLGRLLVEQLRKNLKFQPFAPEFIGLGLGGRPGRFGAVDAERVARREIVILLQFAKDPSDPGYDSIVVDVKNRVGRIDVSQIVHVVVDVLAESIDEFGLVGIEEEKMLSVEGGHELRDDLAIIAALNRIAVVMSLFQKVDQCLRLRRKGGGGHEFVLGTGKPCG